MHASFLHTELSASHWYDKQYSRLPAKALDLAIWPLQMSQAKTEFTLQVHFLWISLFLCENWLATVISVHNVLILLIFFLLSYIAKLHFSFIICNPWTITFLYREVTSILNASGSTLPLLKVTYSSPSFVCWLYVTLMTKVAKTRWE